MSQTRRRMHLAAFMNAGPQGTAGWRHPQAATDFLSARYYTDIARTLEAAMFDLAFIPDSLAVPRSLGATFDPAVRWGAGTPRLDPLPVITLMAAVTRHLGLAATVSTGYNQPYNLARSFATVDHLSGGRAGWNVVTSFQDAEAQNFGEAKLPARDSRYARAEEFLAATTRLWDSWADDALVVDKPSGLFGHPDRVESVNYEGEFFRVQGPLGVPRPPQGYPVIIQAGASPTGRDFAARHGRDPEQLKILTAATPVVGRTHAEALEKHHGFEELVVPEAGLSRLAYHVNVDLNQYDLDGPLPSLAEVGVEGHYREVVEFAEREHLTVRQIGKWYGARTEGDMIGSASEIADRMEQWMERGAADGFMIQATHLPAAFEDFAAHVVPELQRRGHVRTQYEGSTLREHLGLKRPARGEWRQRIRKQAMAG